MFDRQTLIEGTKQIQLNMKKIDLKFLSPRTIAELSENVRALLAILEVVVSTTVST